MRRTALLCTLNSALLDKYLPGFQTSRNVVGAEVAAFRVFENVQKLQAAGEKCQTGGFDLQQWGKVPHQTWDAKCLCDRKWQHCHREVSPPILERVDL